MNIVYMQYIILIMCADEYFQTRQYESIAKITYIPRCCDNILIKLKIRVLSQYYYYQGEGSCVDLLLIHMSGMGIKRNLMMIMAERGSV